MVDWVTVSALATAGGTLVLAVATFASVRSSSKNARVAERALMIGLRPLLLPSRPSDPDTPVGFADEFSVVVPGGGATADVTDEVIYLTLSIRNAGTGLAVLHGWHLSTSQTGAQHAPAADFAMHSRDMYVAPSDLGFWQAAVRDPDAAEFAHLRAAIEVKDRFAVELLYGDLEGGQRTISRFAFLPPGGDGTWTSAVSRHWHLDSPNPR
ncbi:MAG: hypothetical protein ABI912_07715 [Actinomycetota bacterium]